MIGLEILSRDLVAELQRVSSAKQRAASLAASEFAISHAQVEHPLVDKALGKLRTMGVFTPQEKAQIDALTAQLDEEYFSLQEAAEEGRASAEDYLRVFAKARAVAALAFAGNEDSFRGATESIYEAAATIGSDNKGELFGLVKSVLEG
jgi:hypothetical protein